MTKSSVFVKNARKKLGLTQEQMANKLKIARYNLAKYERGASMPPGDIVLKIQELLTK